MQIAFQQFICFAKNRVSLTLILSELLESDVISSPCVIETKALSQVLSFIVELHFSPQNQST